MNGQSKPIDVDPGGALFADGAGAFDVIASLPLADGYSLSFRNFDVQKQKPQIKQLKVIGSESVTVPAGTFDAYKVEILAADNDADKQTVWIDKRQSEGVEDYGCDSESEWSDSDVGIDAVRKVLRKGASTVRLG